MADNIRNFNDYRRKNRNDEYFTEEINIEIQDPLDFLSADEREEYYRSRQAEMDRERESLDEDSPEFYLDDEDHEPVSVEPESPREKPRYIRKRARELEREEQVREERVKKEKVKKEKVPKEKVHKERREGNDNEGGVDPLIIVRISSIVTGLIILALIGMIFKAKVYDKYLRPDPDEEQTEVQVGELAGYTKTGDKIVTTADLNLRNTPSTASDDFIVVQVPEGTTLDRVAVSDDGEWAQVSYDNQLLFCVMKYATVQE
ncbi:hypothetical protein [Butyrivibrio sp. INlla16]|uniref:SH3 domain-containing protein n=1 Tax=Butyrivibrio sp. INlla16 TaxID=1520807 RepID=UPI000881AFFF|nr:hypothetical protein [Butyrivibrio sp. INlla16]SDB54955.1 hypothetical protein SAMN02910263_02792 [Butyrivibrio sp. INlla16]